VLYLKRRFWPWLFSSQSLDAPWCLGIVVENLPQPFDVGIQAVFEIDESVFRPENQAQAAGSADCRLCPSPRAPGRTGHARRNPEAMPFFHNSPVWRSSSNAPKQIFCALWTGTLHPTIAAKSGLRGPPMGGIFHNSRTLICVRATGLFTQSSVPQTSASRKFVVAQSSLVKGLWDI